MAVPVTTQSTARYVLRRSGWWKWAVPAALLIGGIAMLSDPLGRPPPAEELPGELAGEPDLYVEDAVVTQYRPTGALKYRLASRQIRHFDSTSVTRFAAPLLTLYNPPDPPWTVASEHGYVRRRPNAEGVTEEVVFLRNNVALEQRYPHGRRLRMESPSLYIFPDRQYAETDQNVMIDTDVGRTTAVGLRGDLKRGLLKLFSSAQQRVHTIVLPGQFK